MKYEYDYLFAELLSNLIRCMNDHGEDGWRTISVFKDGDYYHAVIEREVK